MRLKDIRMRQKLYVKKSKHWVLDHLPHKVTAIGISKSGNPYIRLDMQDKKWHPGDLTPISCYTMVCGHCLFHNETTPVKNKNKI